MAILENVFFQYWFWYFIEAPKFLFKVWRNFLVFGLNFFSVPLLLKTLFSPWHRYYVSYGRGFDIKVWFEAFISNLIFRTLGAIIRLVIIVLGIVFEAAIFLGGAILILFWLLLPLALFLGLAFAINLLFLR